MIFHEPATELYRLRSFFNYAILYLIVTKSVLIVYILNDKY